MAKSALTPSQAVRKFFEFLRLDRKDVSAIYIFAILAGLVQLALPLGIQTIIGFVLAGTISTSIIVLVTVIVISTFIYGLLQVRQMQIIEKIQQKIFVRLSFEFTDRLPKLNVEKLDNYYLPELVNRFFDTVNLQKGVEKLLLDVPTAIIQIAFGLILLSFYHPVFIGFGALLIFIVYLIIRYTSPKGLETSIKASDYKYNTAAWLEEIARVIKSFKYSRGTTLHIDRADENVSGYLTSRTAHFKILLTQYWSLIAFKVLITAAMLIVGAFLLVDQQINIGQFIAVELVILTIIASVEKLIMNLDKVYDVLTSIYKVSKITDSEIEEEGSALLEDLPRGVGIQFNNVSFKYADGSSALRNINFKINPGQRVCIMGESGAGKSTILRLLTGAYTDFDGMVLLDDIPIGNFNLHPLRSKTGILLSLQDIFHGSLFDNITLGNKSIPLSEITELADKCGLVPFVQSLPKGFDTIIDPTGKRLPGKVKQDILLLRALLGSRRLLLLEEPFIHLERKYKESLLEFLQSEVNSTIVITTSDPEVASICDWVIKMDEGSIIAQGPWSQFQSA